MTKSVKRQKWTPMCHQKYVQKHKKPCSSKCMAQKQNKIRKWSLQRPTKTRCFAFKISCISSIVFLCIHFHVILVIKLLLTCSASSQFEGKALCQVVLCATLQSNRHVLNIMHATLCNASMACFQCHPQKQKLGFAQATKYYVHP